MTIFFGLANNDDEKYCAEIGACFGSMMYYTIIQAIDVDNHWTNTKYCIQQILGSDVQHEDGTRLLASKCATDI